MANYREEHIRNNRRLARQVVGAAALLLALIGLFTVLGWIVGLVRTALDDTDLRNEYRDRLYGMVMLDPVAFDDVNSVDEGIFKQAAIWGTVYQVQNSGGSLDQYERDPDTGSALIPALEIDTYISTDTFGVRWEKGIAVTENGCDVLSPEIGTLYELEF